MLSAPPLGNKGNDIFIKIGRGRFTKKYTIQINLAAGPKGSLNRAKFMDILITRNVRLSGVRVSLILIQIRKFYKKLELLIQTLHNSKGSILEAMQLKASIDKQRYQRIASQDCRNR